MENVLNGDEVWISVSVCQKVRKTELKIKTGKVRGCETRMKTQKGAAPERLDLMIWTITHLVRSMHQLSKPFGSFANYSLLYKIRYTLFSVPKGDRNHSFDKVQKHIHTILIRTC